MKAASLVFLFALTAVGAADPPARKAVLLDDGSLLEGTVESFDQVVRITPSTGKARIVLVKQVAFVGETGESVYEYVAGKVDAKSTDGARQLAAWCEKSGMNRKAILHARTVLANLPEDKGAKEMIARLERAQPSKPMPAKVDAAPPPMPERASGAAAAFATKVQPILSNQCASCHADKNHAGAFKLNRIADGYANPDAVAANLKAVAAQLDAANPSRSPLLVHSLTAHGGQKRAAFANRDANAYQLLEAWVSVSLPKPVSTSGFASSAPPTIKPEEPPAALPGAIVGATGRPAAPVAPKAPPPVAAPVAPAPSADPFDPNAFNRLPKKAAK